MKRRFHIPTSGGLFVLSGLALALGPAWAQEVAWPEGAERPAFEITITDDGIEAPDSVEAGFYRLAADDQSGLEVDILIARLEDGASAEELIAAIEEINAAFMGEGNPGEAMARIDELASAVGGQSTPANALFELVPGEYVVLSVSSTEDGQNHTELGLFDTFTVTEAAEQVEAPAVDLTVDMLDFAFTLPDEVPAGQQVWEVVNVGEQVHHMVLMRVLEGNTVEDVMAFLESAEGEAAPPAEEVAYVPIIDSEERILLPLDLTPGEYVALCFMPDYETGQPHVMLGMVDSFTVAGE